MQIVCVSVNEGVRGSHTFLVVISIDCGVSYFEPSGSAANGIVTFFLSNTFLFNQIPIGVFIM
jgi:hypothetical protein